MLIVTIYVLIRISREKLIYMDQSIKKGFEVIARTEPEKVRKIRYYIEHGYTETEIENAGIATLSFIKYIKDTYYKKTEKKVNPSLYKKPLPPPYKFKLYKETETCMDT